MAEEKSMRRAVLQKFHHPLVIETVPVPEPGDGEILVKVMASGLCVSDVHIQEGRIASVKLPYTPGHEMAGIIWKLGANTEGRGLTVGQHVICGIDSTCGTCALCRGGRENLCRSRVRVGFERDGSHAEYAVVPYENLYPIPEKIPFEQAAVIPDAVACMYHAIKSQGHAGPGDRVLFYGTGALGLQGVQIACCFGAEVYAASRTQAKLDKAAQFGAKYLINTGENELYTKVKRLTGGALCDVAFDLVGNSDTIDLLLKCVRPGGKVVALAYGSDHFTINCQELVIQEKEVLGLRGSTSQDLLESIALVEKGAIIPFVSHRYQLEEINLALDQLRDCRGLGRSVILFDEGTAVVDRN